MAATTNSPFKFPWTLLNHSGCWEDVNTYSDQTLLGTNWMRMIFELIAPENEFSLENKEKI